MNNQPNQPQQNNDRYQEFLELATTCRKLFASLQQGMHALINLMSKLGEAEKAGLQAETDFILGSLKLALENTSVTEPVDRQELAQAEEHLRNSISECIGASQNLKEIQEDFGESLSRLANDFADILETEPLNLDIDALTNTYVNCLKYLELKQFAATSLHKFILQLLT